MSVAFVFAGQGSQSARMLAAYEGCGQVAAAVQEAGAALGEDLAAVIADEEKINLTANTQPAMLAMGVGVWHAWRALHPNAPAPSVFAGHSLGEYCALVCAGSLPLADAARLVRRRAQHMQNAVPAGEGAMAAVIGAMAEEVRGVCGDIGDVWAANINSPKQIVIAGSAAAVGRAGDELQARKLARRVTPLAVSVPSHCPLMKPAAEAFAKDLAEVKFAAPRIPIAHNADPASLNSIAENIAPMLAAQLTAPVDWTRTIGEFVALGCQTVVEAGPGRTLTNLGKRIAPEAAHIALDDAAALRDAPF